MYIKDRDNTIEKLLKYIKKLTDDGHGFTVDVDIDDKEYQSQMDRPNIESAKKYFEDVLRPISGSPVGTPNYNPCGRENPRF